MGPRAFALFDDVLPTLRDLLVWGLRLGVIPDWRRGLAHFCDALGIGPYVDAVVASAEVGFEKPDPRLLEAAQVRLGVPADETLHVGDSALDVEGAGAAGCAAVLLARGGEPPARGPWCG